MSKAEALRGLCPSGKGLGRTPGTTDEEVVEAIRAIRRGATWREVSEVLGYTDPRGSGQALRCRVGGWAVEHAVLPELGE